MRYSFPQIGKSKSRFQTYNLVRSVLIERGHTVYDDLTDDCDAVLFSACDVLDILNLRRLRKLTAKPIVAGGAFAFNFWAASLYADFVWVGEVFDFAEIYSLADLANSPHVFVNGSTNIPSASTRIEWERIPITQISKNKAYYWGGVGCKNRCHFCFTSWTHFRQRNKQELILAAQQEVKRRKKIYLMITDNYFDEACGEAGTTRDMLLRDYICRPVKASVVRCGIEFASELVRKAKAKDVSRNDIYAAIQKMSIDGLALRLFHITGYEPLVDWDTYISDLCLMLRKHPPTRLLHLVFNNLQYQNYTPLYRERRNINPDYYIDHRTTKDWYDRIRQFAPHVLISAPSPFQHVACRMGLELSRHIEQAEYWARMFPKARNVSPKKLYDNLFSSGVLDAPRLLLKQNGIISIC